MMSAPCSLCLEDLLTQDPDRRYLRCVAMPGRQPGLRLRTDGSVGWQTLGAIACELMVSRDQRLLLFRPMGAPAVDVLRAGRRLSAPYEKPVVLLDEDEVHVAGRRLRVHIHGETKNVAPPSFLAGSKTVATMLAFGGAVLSCDRPPAVEHYPSPAEVASVQPPASTTVSTVALVASASEAGADSGAAPAASSAGPVASAEVSPPRPAPATKTPPKQPRPRKPPIEVRDMPPFAE